MGDICNDNREILISKYFEQLKEKTNIETSYEEMQVVRNILFRMWQLGWLDRLEKTEKEKEIAEDLDRDFELLEELNDGYKNGYKEFPCLSSLLAKYKRNKTEAEENEINPCEGCEDYDGKGGCKSNGGCIEYKYCPNCGADLDGRCVRMCYIQLSLAGVPAVVHKRDTLSMKTFETWVTPAYTFNYLKFRRYGEQQWTSKQNLKTS